MSFSKYTNKNAEEVLEILKSSAAGLSKKEALLRQKKHGLNEIKSKSISALHIFIRQLKSPFTYLFFSAKKQIFLLYQLPWRLTLPSVFFRSTRQSGQFFSLENTFLQT